MINGNDETTISALVDKNDGYKSSSSSVITAKEALSLCDKVHPFATCNDEY